MDIPNSVWVVSDADVLRVFGFMLEEGMMPIWLRVEDFHILEELCTQCSDLRSFGAVMPWEGRQSGFFRFLSVSDMEIDEGSPT